MFAYCDIVYFYVSLHYNQTKGFTYLIQFLVMTNLANSEKNSKLIEALKVIKETDWCGNTAFNDLESCLVSINLESRRNSGFYIPSVAKIKGISGLFLVNEDGSLLYDFRVTKRDSDFLIERFTNSAFNKFEQRYIELIRIN